jgi:hypothetical protein
MITYIPYEEDNYDFVFLVSQLFRGQELNRIHKLSNEDYHKLFEIGHDSSTEFHKTFYDKYRSGWKVLETMYANFIENVVAHQFNEDFLFQKFPTFRVALPENVAVGAFHSDSEFGHPDGEVNFIIPLTNSDYTASVWVESEPGKKDFKPIKLRVGWLVRFNGNKLTHGNRVNQTTLSRVSMDFRVLPISKYDEVGAKESITTKTKYTEGQYYSKFKKK